MAGPLIPDAAAVLGHRARNALKTLILLGMALLLGVMGALLGGVGALWPLALSGLLLALSRRGVPALLLRVYGGRSIGPATAACPTV